MGDDKVHSLPPPRRLTYTIRFGIVVGVLAVELLGLTLRYDLGRLHGSSEWWAALLRQVPLLTRLAVTIAVAAVFFCAPAVRDVLTESRSISPMRGGALLLLLIGHALAVIGVYLFSGRLLEGPASAESGWEFALWLIYGLAAIVTLGLFVFPAGVWKRFVARQWPSLLVAVVVGLLAWGGSLLSAQLWEPLGRSTLWSVWQLLRQSGQEIIYDPAAALIGTKTYPVEIAPQCSGYEGIGLILAFIVGYLWVYRRELRFPHALLLLPLGAVLAWAANVLRITALILLGSSGAADIADGGFHSQAGVLGFSAIALGIVLLTQRFHFFNRSLLPEATGPRTGSADPTTAYLLPFLVLVAVSMITSAFTAGFDRLYPLRVIAVGAVLWYFRHSYPRLRWSWFALSVGLIAAVLWILLVPAGTEHAMPVELAAAPIGWEVVWLAMRLVGSCVTVPLAEELAFRGYLTRRLIDARFETVPMGEFTWASFLISSSLYAAMYGMTPAALIAGALYALVLYRRRELSDAILAHAATNAALAGYALITGQWAVWT